MAKIKAKWPKSGQNLGIGGQNDGSQARIRVFWQDLGHFAWIWAILLEFGLFRKIRVRIGLEEDEALRMGQGGTNKRADRRTDRFPL